ncbi:MAG: diphthine synthase [Candidatus Hadarchaeum sp.]|uniref:diphthine synthase n=1 Tax=Candidatus Hadarchaeum sp. TaxID=2883567 RepID=UPI003179567F
MLTFIGLGLGPEGISLQGLRELQEADVVYAELYTSLLPGFDISQLERRIGRQVKRADRKMVEENPEEILTAAREKRVSFLVPGDPMVATTHVDLRLRAARSGIKTRIIHGVSIASAAAGLLGLQSYKFGPSATIPFPDNPSTRPYEILAENFNHGWHTMLFLDLREEREAMTANEAIGIMFGLEERLKGSVFTAESLTAVVARAGADDVLVRADRAEKLQREDFGPPPHLLVVPGRLHFLEADALEIFAGAPKEVVQWHMSRR